MAVLRAPSPFIHVSEAHVAERLRAMLPERCVLVANVVLPQSASDREIDLVAIMPEGIVVIEVKHWFGKLREVGRMIEFENGYRVRAPFAELSYKAKQVRGLLIRHGAIGSDVAVGRMLITSEALNWPTEVLLNEQIYALPALSSKTPLLAALENHDHGARLKRRQVEAIADLLSPRDSAIDRWSVGDYQLLEEFRPDEGARSFFARSTNLLARDAVLRCWELDPVGVARDPHDALHELRHEASALARVEGHRCPAIPIVYDAFTDPSNFHVFWLAHESIGMETLHSEEARLLDDRGLVASVVDQLGAALGVLAAARIVHRAIRPEVVFLREDGRVLLSGFELSAALDGRTTRRPLPTDAPRTPEERSGDDATPAGDLYAVGRMLLTWLAPNAKTMSTALRSVKPTALRDALAAVLEEDPSARPNHLGALNRALRQGATS